MTDFLSQQMRISVEVSDELALRILDLADRIIYMKDGHLGDLYD